MVLQSRTVIDTFEFDFLTEVEIKSSLEEMTNTARLTIPKKLNYKRNGKLITNVVEGADPLFRRGSVVTLQAGYTDQFGNSELNTVFQGYVSDIKPKLPLEFSIQDEMYKLKQVTVTNYSEKNLTLKKLLTDILPSGYQFEALDVQLGWFRIKRSNVVSIFEHLKSHYGLTCNFRDGVLYAGLRYITTNPLELRVSEFEFERNIINDSNLTYRRDDDIAIKLRAISINEKNEKIETEVGDQFGDQRTMYFYGLSMSDLTKIAEESLVKMKYEGFYGSFETFLLPKVETGEAVKLINGKLPEKNGIYLVKEVATRYGVNGGRQVITLDRKIA